MLIHLDVFLLIGELLNFLHLLVIVVRPSLLIYIDVVTEAIAAAVNVARTTFSTHLFKSI